MPGESQENTAKPRDKSPALEAVFIGFSAFRGLFLQQIHSYHENDLSLPPTVKCTPIKAPLKQDRRRNHQMVKRAHCQQINKLNLLTTLGRRLG